MSWGWLGNVSLSTSLKKTFRKALKRSFKIKNCSTFSFEKHLKIEISIISSRIGGISVTEKVVLNVKLNIFEY